MKKLFCNFYYLIIPLMILLTPSFVITDIKTEMNFDSIFKIRKTEINFSESPSCRFITCIGEIENLTNEVWYDFVIEVKYYNSKGSLIDTDTERFYPNVLQAKDTISFRIRTQTTRNASEYSSHTTRITWADKKYSYVSQKKHSLIKNILINWTPIIILIGVWIFFMYWNFSKKKSPQAKSLEILKNNTVLIEKQNQLFERLVKTIENKNKS
ncbi:MAG: hypothetical protein SWO11_03125 [Thermodesulfobacteriota bacterium]|nr:hypothetical protein [Thermodesulfobacteriota bacterium]